ncbi:MAG: hypothetical protein ACKVY0_17410 [Prosthecobacter sp.]|uniref:hypothetical protein n=1 Tax=Prosthecobacter sp. TaxID=1965333 RepID=UPI0039025DD7
MNSLANALAYAMAYLGTVARESEADEDNDADALESIAAELASITPRERQALQDAAKLAISSEETSESPNYSLINGCNDVLEHLKETED